MKSFAQLIAFAAWVTGFVLAAGWWKLLAFFVPFYGWYLIIKLALTHYGFI